MRSLPPSLAGALVGVAATSCAVAAAILLFTIGVTGPALGVIVGIVALTCILVGVIRITQRAGRPPTPAKRLPQPLGRSALVVLPLVAAGNIAVLATGGGDVWIITLALNAATFVLVLLLRRGE